MSLNKIVYDLETQKDFAEVGGRNKPHLLKISVAVAYSYLDDEYHIFEEKNIHKLGEMFQVADQIIGFNSKHFDNQVLQPYLHFDLEKIPHLDILEEVEEALGHRIGLDAIAKATLGEGKTASGLEAIAMWKEGRLQELKDYCKKDVETTKKIYEYGCENKKLLFEDFFDKREIPVEFEQPEKRKNTSKQVSLF